MQRDDITQKIPFLPTPLLPTRAAPWSARKWVGVMARKASTFESLRTMAKGGGFSHSCYTRLQGVQASNHDKCSHFFMTVKLPGLLEAATRDRAFPRLCDSP